MQPRRLESIYETRFLDVSVGPNERKELVGVDYGLANSSVHPASLTSSGDQLQFVFEEKPFAKNDFETSYYKVNQHSMHVVSQTWEVWKYFRQMSAGFLWLPKGEALFWLTTWMATTWKNPWPSFFRRNFPRPSWIFPWQVKAWKFVRKLSRRIYRVSFFVKVVVRD